MRPEGLHQSDGDDDAGTSKAGLAVMGAEEFTGALYLADIGVPEAVYRRMGIDVGPIFSGSDLLRLS